MPKPTLEVERGIPDFIGEGEAWTAAVLFRFVVSGVKLTCLIGFEAPGVVGSEGRDFSKFGLLGLLLKEGIDD